MLGQLIRWIDGAQIVAVGEFDGKDEIPSRPYAVLLYQGYFLRHAQFIGSVWPWGPSAFKGYRLGCAWTKGAPMPNGMSWVRSEASA